MYNLIEYSKNYKKTIGSLWNYYRDEPNNPPLVGDSLTANYNADPITNSKSFKYKSSIIEKTLDNDDDNDENNNRKKNKDVEIVVPLKHLSNVWRTLDMPLISCYADKQNTYWAYLYTYLGIRNLNVYLTSLYFTNLYLTILTRIQNALIRTQ